jgi:hypothetical protein
MTEVISISLTVFSVAMLGVVLFRIGYQRGIQRGDERGMRVFHAIMQDAEGKKIINRISESWASKYET